MSMVGRKMSSQELEELTTSISEMASRINAQFVPDEQKKQNFLSASEKRETSKVIRLESD